MYNSLHENILDNVQDGVIHLDTERRITYWNKGAETVTGYTKAEVVGKSCADNIIKHISYEGVCLCENGCPLRSTLLEGISQEAEVYLKHKQGHRVPIELKVSPVRDSEGRITGAIQVFRDISQTLELKKMVESLEKTSLIDPLTEIGNRRYADMILRNKLDYMRRESRPFGAMLIDVDDFKQVNDVYGHDIGDRVLKMVAKTLGNCARAYDTVCRWGGEEFFVIISVTGNTELYEVAERMRLFIEQSSFTSDDSNIGVTVSIGASLAGRNDTVETLYRRVDQLMYRSKRCGKNCVTTQDDMLPAVRGLPVKITVEMAN
ncbi:MAG TPA: diguanylate cyclase [bacterium]|nr:diguanylate cyclase [bacterium]